jgi:hypothetical protein
MVRDVSALLAIGQDRLAMERSASVQVGQIAIALARRAMVSGSFLPAMVTRSHG